MVLHESGERPVLDEGIPGDAGPFLRYLDDPPNGQSIQHRRVLVCSDPTSTDLVRRHRTVDPAILPFWKTTLQSRPLRTQTRRERATRLHEPPESLSSGHRTANSRTFRFVFTVAPRRATQDAAADEVLTLGREIGPPATQ